jgi:hypothetical protein
MEGLMTVAVTTHVTVHLARFDKPVTLDPIDTGPAIGDPLAWMVGADNIAARTPLGSSAATVRVALGHHADEHSARTVFEAGADSVPYLAAAGETWAALLEPIGHRGEVNWLDAVQPGRAWPGLAFAPVVRRPEGPCMVTTSVGWTFDERFDATKATDFASGVERVRAAMDGVDGLHSQQSFCIPASLADPITITFWHDDAVMRAFAYRPGEHKFQLDRFRQREAADRSSFTRL